MADNKSESAPTPPSKSAFVRSIPREVPAAEVVEKAKAAGITINQHYVHNVRSAANTTPKKSGAKKAKKAAKSGAKKVAPKAPAKKGAAKKPAEKKKSAPTKSAAKKGAANKPAAKKSAAKKSAAPKAAPKTPAAKAAPKKTASAAPTGDKRAFIESQPATMTGSQVVKAAKKAGIVLSANYVYKVRTSKKSKGGSKAGGAKAAPAAAARTSSASHGGSPEVLLSRLVVDHGIGKVQALLADVERRVTSLLAGR